MLSSDPSGGTAFKTWFCGVYYYMGHFGAISKHSSSLRCKVQILWPLWALKCLLATTLFGNQPRVEKDHIVTKNSIFDVWRCVSAHGIWTFTSVTAPLMLKTTNRFWSTICCHPDINMHFSGTPQLIPAGQCQATFCMLHNSIFTKRVQEGDGLPAVQTCPAMNKHGTLRSRKHRNSGQYSN